MCGINGFNFQDKELIDRQMMATAHRGPDDKGAFIGQGISLGHNRLSIIDLSSAGHQPMMSRDDNFVIVYNGELYNYRELRKELEDKGEIFYTESDTEVVLRLYEKYGSKSLEKFDGIFAFAIWDKKKQELFLARDQFGVKPLFYYFDNDKFIFSSEIKGILEHEIKREINRDALNTFFRLLYSVGPETIFKNVFKLNPGSFLILKNKKLIIEKYWSLNNFQDNKDSKAGTEKKIRQILRKSVQKQMVADVDVGVFLSGGIDSTIILGLAKENTDKKIKTFSVGFDLPKDFFSRFNQDYLLAQKTAKYYNTDHFDVLLKEKDVIENFEKVVWHMDDLVYSPTQVANFVLAKMASKEVKVVLGGDGGDELFGGYKRYWYYNLVNKWQKIPKIMRKNFALENIFALIKKEDIYKRLNLREIDLFWSFMAQKEKLLSRALNSDFNNLQNSKNYFFRNFDNKIFDNKKVDLTKAMMLIDLSTWLVDFSFTRSDKMSMAHALEQRVPFMDKDLAQYAMTIPTKFKIKDSRQGKEILKTAMQDYIPDFVYNKEKTGWFVPVAKWLRSGLKDYAYTVLSENYNNGKTNEYINFKEVKVILDNHIQGREYALNTVWSLITFQVWYKQFMN